MLPRLSFSPDPDPEFRCPKHHSRPTTTSRRRPRPNHTDRWPPAPQTGEHTAAAPADAAGETDAAWIAAADSDHDDAVAFSQELEIRPAPEPGTLALVPGQKVRGKILAIGEEQ